MRFKNLLPCFLVVAALIAGCAQPASQDSGATQALEQSEATGLGQLAGGVKADPNRCETNKEWWRSSAEPKRGGTAVAAAGATTTPHLDVTAGGAVGHK